MRLKKRLIAPDSTGETVDEFKRMARVCGYIALPSMVFLVIGFQIDDEDHRVVTFIIGGLISMAVAAWIWICRSNEGDADI